MNTTPRATGKRGGADLATRTTAEHPDVERLLAYGTGELGGADHAELQEHLLECRNCIQVLLDAEQFRAGGEADDGTSKLMSAVAWRALQPRLHEAERKRRTPWRAPLAAALLAGVIGWGAASLLEPPAPAPAVLEALGSPVGLEAGERRSTGAGAEPVVFSAGVDQLPVDLELTAALAAAGPLSLRLVDADGNPVAGGGAPEGIQVTPDDEGYVTFLLRRQPEGTYGLQVLQSGDADDQVLVELLLDVQHR